MYFDTILLFEPFFRTFAYTLTTDLIYLLVKPSTEFEFIALYIT